MSENKRDDAFEKWLAAAKISFDGKPTLWNAWNAGCSYEQRFPKPWVAGSNPAACTEPALDVVLTRGPGPESDFVEIEVAGRSVVAGQWLQTEDGLAILRLTRADFPGPDQAIKIGDGLEELAELAGRIGVHREGELDPDPDVREILRQLEQQVGALIERLCAEHGGE